MVYQFAILSDEVEGFARQISIDAEATFLELNNAILDSVGYDNSQPTFFYLSNDDWDRKTQISLFDVEMNSEEDNYLMDNTVIRDLVEEKGQKLLYVFNYIDGVNDGVFYIQLQNIEPTKHLEAPKCTLKKGTPPPQKLDDDELFTSAGKTDSSILDADDFYGSDGYNDEELDEEGLNTDTINPDDIY